MKNNKYFDNPNQIHKIRSFAAQNQVIGIFNLGLKHSVPLFTQYHFTGLNSTQ